MENVQQFRQAYLQAPWRRQLQIALTFLLVLISVAIVAYIYLSVTTRAAAVGREIQYMQVQMAGYHGLTEQDTGSMPIEELKQNIANLESQLGQLTSFEVMDERAKELGLEPAHTPSGIASTVAMAGRRRSSHRHLRSGSSSGARRTNWRSPV